MLKTKNEMKRDKRLLQAVIVSFMLGAITGIILMYILWG